MPDLPQPPALREDEERELLRIARATLREFFASGIIPPGAPHRKALLEPTPVWVRIHDATGQRGSFGVIEPARPLWRGVQEAAVQAAVSDPRGPSVEAGELDRVRLEILVLSPLAPVASVDQIEGGRHGVAVTVGTAHAVLLPDGAGGADLLRRACEKAGLPAEAWRGERAVIRAFSVHSFAEPPLGPVKERTQ